MHSGYSQVKVLTRVHFTLSWSYEQPMRHAYPFCSCTMCTPASFESSVPAFKNVNAMKYSGTLMGLGRPIAWFGGDLNLADQLKILLPKAYLDHVGDRQPIVYNYTMEHGIHQLILLQINYNYITSYSFDVLAPSSCSSTQLANNHGPATNTALDPSYHRTHHTSINAPSLQLSNIFKLQCRLNYCLGYPASSYFQVFELRIHSSPR